MKRLFLFTMISLMSLNSCKSDDESTSDDTSAINGINLVSENATISVNDNIEDIKDNLLDNEESFGGRSMNAKKMVLPKYECATITVTKPKTETDKSITYLVQFPVEGCVGLLGNVHKGQLSINVLRESPTKVTSITIPIGYSFNDNKVVDGTNSKVTTVKNANIYTRNSNLTIKRPSGTTFVRNATYTSTVTVSQNKIIFSTIGEATNKSDSVEWTGEATSSNPLIWETDCLNIKSGKIIYTFKSRNYVLDYGNGTCDNQATLTYPSGKVENITLGK